MGFWCNLTFILILVYKMLLTLDTDGQTTADCTEAGLCAKVETLKGLCW